MIKKFSIWIVVITTLLLCSVFFNTLLAQCYSLPYSNLIGTNPTTDIGSGVYYMNDNVIINSDIVISDAEILVAPGAKIFIRQGTLTIKGCHFYGCTEMWGGIVMDYNAGLIIDRSTTHDNTLIEDAEIGISASVNHNVGTQNDLLSVQNTIFNRNKMGIKLTSSIYEASDMVPYNMQIGSSVFTCRNLPFTPPKQKLG